MDRDEEDLCLIAYRQETLDNAVKKWRSATQMIDISMSYLAVRLHQHNSVWEVFEAGLDRQVDAGELPSIAAHALLRR